MFSFFSKKKNTPDISPEETDPIPGANSSSSNGNGGDDDDDFTIVERRPAPTPPFPPQNNLYPVMPPGYPPGEQHNHHVLQRQQTLGPAGYLSGVPFILSDAISTENSFESQQSQIDGILAIMTRSLQISNSFEYDFAVERNIVDQ